MALNNLTKVQTLGIGSNIEVVGVITTGQFKSGTSNLHSTGVDLTNLNVSGIATIGGNLSIGGTLTYQDVTNIDSVGLITARAGIQVTGGNVTIGDAATHTYSAHSEGDDLVIGGAGWRGMTIYGEGGGGVIQFADNGNNRIGQILYNHSNNSMLFRTGGNTTRFEINYEGHLFAPNLNSGSGHADVRYVTSNGQFIYDSSTRLVKTDIEDCSYGLTEIKQLKPRIYKRTDADNMVEVGLIADEVHSILPEICATEKKSFFTKNESDTEIIPSNVDLKRLTVILTKAIQEQQEQIEQLKQENISLRARVTNLEGN